MRCVPFTGKGAMMYGLTVCCHVTGGIIGLGTHFRRYSEAGVSSVYSIWQGRYDGCILHIRLKPKERISAIWASIHEEGFPDWPYLRVSIRTWLTLSRLKRKVLMFPIGSILRSYRVIDMFTHWLHECRD